MIGKGSNPLVSIILPIYNTAPYLSRCLDSIIGQTYRELEIICVDDGSTDQSGAILDEIKKGEGRLKVIHTEKRGVSAARNLALASATGDYIGFVDSDDYIDEKMYENLVDLITTNNVDFVICGYYMVDEKTITRAVNKEKVPERQMDRSEALYYIYKRDEYKAVAGYLWNKLFRRELIKSKQGKQLIKFDEELDIGEDIVFLAEVCRHVKNVWYTEKALYYYYQRHNSAVHDSIRQLKGMSWSTAYEKVIRIYEDMNVPLDLLNIIRRMYVYRCGRLLEIAIHYNDITRARILKCNIKKYLPHYVETNIEHIDRLKWIVDLLYEIE